MDTLVITKVDYELLEKQRLNLHNVIDKLTAAGEDTELLQGLANMLDSWSDENYYEAKK
jgi:hypothetical protein